MNRQKYLINELKYKYGIKVKKIKMADSGTYYIAYKEFTRDICTFKEPINNKLYDCLEDILNDMESKKEKCE